MNAIMSQKSLVSLKCLVPFHLDEMGSPSVYTEKMHKATLQLASECLEKGVVPLCWDIRKMFQTGNEAMMGIACLAMPYSDLDQECLQVAMRAKKMKVFL